MEKWCLLAALGFLAVVPQATHQQCVAGPKNYNTMTLFDVFKEHPTLYVPFVEDWQETGGFKGWGCVEIDFKPNAPNGSANAVVSYKLTNKTERVKVDATVKNTTLEFTTDIEFFGLAGKKNLIFEYYLRGAEGTISIHFRLCIPDEEYSVTIVAISKTHYFDTIDVNRALKHLKENTYYGYDFIYQGVCSL